MKPIVKTPNPVLVKPAAVVILDAATKKTIKDMKKTLELADNPKGVGLAATQIGESLRIFLMRPEEKDPIRVFINPTYVKKSDKTVKGIPGSDNRLEGCLSIPGIWGIVTRHETVDLSYMTESGETKVETFKDFEAIIVQHEMDHLDGILFPRRVVEQKGELYQSAIDEETGKEILKPLEL